MMARINRKAIGYCRGSTDAQAITCEAQAAKAYAALHDIELIDVIEDEATTSKTPLCERPGGKRASRLLDRKEAQAIIVVKIDRAFRNTIECLQAVESWDKRGVQLHIIDFGGATINTRTSTGKLLLTFLAGVAEWERATIGERTSAALQHKRSRGEFVGTVPFGFKLASDGIHLHPVATEQATIRLIRTLREDEGLSYHAIAEELNDRGIAAKAGGQWHGKVIMDICRRELVTA
jgi:site-specific DNA recombinase